MGCELFLIGIALILSAILAVVKLTLFAAMAWFWVFMPLIVAVVLITGVYCLDGLDI